MATALLLQFELWADASYLSTRNRDGDNGNYDATNDALFTYGASLKNTLLACFEPGDVHRSSVMTHLANDATLSDVCHIDASTTAHVQDFFLRERRFGREDLASPTIPPADAHAASQQASLHSPTDIAPFTPIITALAPLLAHLSQSQLPTELGVSSIALSPTPSTSTKIARHILCFPILCRGAFASKIATRDPRALLILYHFFRAARMLLRGDEFWWAKGRAVAVERGLGAWLEKDA
jgi:hypothetical protein